MPDDDYGEPLLPPPPLEMEYAHSLLCALLSNPAVDSNDPDLALRAQFHAQRLLNCYPLPQDPPHGPFRSDH